MSDQIPLALLKLLVKQLQELSEFNKTQIFNPQTGLQVSTVWIPRPLAMKFFGYQDTQMTAMARKNNLVSAKVGAKIFYHRDSIEALLNKSVQ